MIQEFNDMHWHDAELKEIIIDRAQKDKVKLLIHWPETDDNSSSFIEFFGCYAFKSNMHFGINPPDSILDAQCITHSEELDNLKKIWFEMGLDLSGLHCYRIRTNSTNSTIDIFSLGFEVT